MPATPDGKMRAQMVLAVVASGIRLRVSPDAVLLGAAAGALMRH